MNRRTLLGSLIVAPAVVATGGVIMAHGDSTPAPSHTTHTASPVAGMGDTGTGAAYLTITNNGDTDDRLIAAASDAAQVVEIHDMVVENEVMSMIHLEEGLPVPAGESVVLEPMSLHIMLISLNESLLPDMTFELTLTFEGAGEVTVPVLVATEKPDGGEVITFGDLEVSGVWSRPAPRLTAGMEGTPDATPAH
jgi:periplasmic copper chaperone A